MTRAAATITRAPLSDRRPAVRSGFTGGVLPAPRNFVKCAGGKTKLVEKLRELLPKTTTGMYYEPFVGGGALFWALNPAKAVLGDMNGPLIATYITIRDEPERLIALLRHPRYANNEDKYYAVRKTAFNRIDWVAADYIYLNKVGYNGLFRVNKSGGFNVPFGRYDNPTICDADNILACSRALQGVWLEHKDFALTVKSAKAKDIVYFDCPYWPVNATSNFTAYTAGGFGPDDHVRLRDTALALKKRGVFVLLSNADVQPVRDLYRKDFKIVRVEMARSINSDGAKRGKVGELLMY